MTEPTVPANPVPTDELPARRVAWAVLLIPAVLQLLLHLFTNGRFGIFRDEYYYLACASRPAFGYVDQPPLSIWMLTAWRAVFGDSVHSIRILPGLCGSALILLTGATAAQLGGSRWAQLFAGVAAGIGAAGLVIGGFYSMNCYDLLFWLGAYYLLIKIVRSDDGRLWPWFGLVVGIGLFNKVGLLVMGAALVVGLLATKHRRHFADKRLYLAGVVAIVFLIPYLLWNLANDWPTIEFMQYAKKYKISDYSPLGFLSENILEANPLTVPLWVGGLLWLFFARVARRFRILAIMFVVTWIILILQKSKPYYFASSMPMMFAAGGVAWERWTSGRLWRWGRWAMVVVLIAGLVIFLPLALPVLSPAGVDAYQQKLGIVPSTGEVGHTADLPQYFADRIGWEDLARTVSAAYESLPEDERSNCVVIGRNYGHSGALEYWSKVYDLPPVYGRHNNYWLWGPPPVDENTVIIAINFNPEWLAENFDTYEEAGVSETPYAQESRFVVWVCRGLRRPIGEVWDEIKLFI